MGADMRKIIETLLLVMGMAVPPWPQTTSTGGAFCRYLHCRDRRAERPKPAPALVSHQLVFADRRVHHSRARQEDALRRHLYARPDSRSGAGSIFQLKAGSEIKGQPGKASTVWPATRSTIVRLRRRILTGERAPDGVRGTAGGPATSWSSPIAKEYPRGAIAGGTLHSATLRGACTSARASLPAEGRPLLAERSERGSGYT